MRIDGELVQAPSVPPVQSRGSGRAKRILIGGIGILAFLAIIVFVLWSKDLQEEPPHRLNSVWTAKVDGAARLYFVMEEKRVRRGSFDTRGIHSYNLPYSIFTLHALNGVNGDAPTIMPIGRTDGGVVDRAKFEVRLNLIEAPVILGPHGDVIWLWNDGLEARNLKTLECVWSMDKLKELNPELGAFLPKEVKYYKVLGVLNALTYKGSDAQYFQIDPASGKIKVVPDATLAKLSREHSKTADMAFYSLWPDSDSLWSTSVSGLMWDSTIHESTKTWYGLLTPDERPSSDWRHPKYSFGGPTGEVARSLFHTRYKTERSRMLNETHVLLDVANVKKLGDERFLMGGFLRRPNTENIWMVNDSKAKSFLVLHKKALGQDQPWHVTRLGRDGHVLWTTSTGLADLQHLCDGHGAVVFTGFANHSQPTNERPDLMVFIDEGTGQNRTVNLTTGEMSNYEG